MTTDQIIAYYVKLIILQYYGLPKASATIAAQVGPVIMDQLPMQVNDGYNLLTAVGTQLDILGKYCGVTRYANTFNGPVTLNDDDFRILIQMAIIENFSSGTLAEIQQLLFQFFNGAIRVFDNQDMHLNYTFDPLIINSQLVEVFLAEGLLPHPLGVGVGSGGIIIPPLPFSFRTYSSPAPGDSSPFNNYGSYTLTWPWVSYQDLP